jgi:hypothetical protein
VWTADQPERSSSITPPTADTCRRIFRHLQVADAAKVWREVVGHDLDVGTAAIFDMVICGRSR